MVDIINDVDFKAIDLLEGSKKVVLLHVSIDWLHLDFIMLRDLLEDDHELSILVDVLLEIEDYDRITTTNEEAYEDYVVLVTQQVDPAYDLFLKKHDKVQMVDCIKTIN